MVAYMQVKYFLWVQYAILLLFQAIKLALRTYVANLCTGYMQMALPMSGGAPHLQIRSSSHVILHLGCSVIATTSVFIFLDTWTEQELNTRIMMKKTEGRAIR